MTTSPNQGATPGETGASRGDSLSLGGSGGTNRGSRSTGTSEQNQTRGGRGNKNRNSNAGRGQGRRNRGPRSRTSGRANTDFWGDTVEMNGHVFQTFQESRDRRQFVKTLDALGQYINKNMKYGSDLTILYKSLGQPQIAKPSAAGLDLENDPANKIEWVDTYKGYVGRRRELEDNVASP